MSFTTLLTCFAALSTTGWAQYVLEDDYLAGNNFFDLFSFWDTADPTDGFVAYQSQSDASSMQLINATTSNVYMGVDSQNVTPNGRPSVRITSNKAYQSGLFIVDVEHMPGGICGTWPAFWLVGPDWPDQGEIDIIEGVNQQSTNAMTLHTDDGCSITNNGAFSGTIQTSNCYIDAAGQGDNAGCSISTTNTATYGADFNANGGGVYATEWTSSAISIYFFPRGSIPADITSGSPMPSGWGTPIAQFQGGCDIPEHFTNLQIVFDTTFCGSWAGEVWSSGSCAAQADTCNDYVENNPSDFADAYWSVNALQVYSSSGTSQDTASVSIAATSSVASASASVAGWSPSYSMSEVAASSSAAVVLPSTTTFAVSVKPTAPVSIISTGVPVAPSSVPAFNVSAPYPTGNATNGTYPTGSVPSASATGVSSYAPLSSSMPVIVSSSASVSAASVVPSSPAETTPASSAAAVSTAATSTEAAPESYQHWTHTWDHQRYTPQPQAIKRHLRHHKRHAAGGF